MTKPICLLYFPENFVGGHDSNWIYKFMRSLNGETDGEWKPNERTQDYIWFCFYKDNITEPELQVFHEKDWTDIQQQELKELILNLLPKT